MSDADELASKKEGETVLHVADVNILPDATDETNAPPIVRQPSDSNMIAAANELRETMRRESERHVVSPQKVVEEKQAGEGDDDNVSDDLRQAYSTDAHKMSEEELAKEYSTHLERGLTDENYKIMKEKFGLNQLTPRESEPEWKKVLKSIFGGFFNILLWLGSVLSIVGYLVDPTRDPANLYIGTVLAFVVTVTGLFSYFQDSKSDAIMEGFKNFLPQHVKVVRNGVEAEIEAVELVPGDLIALDFGDKVPADVRIIQATRDLQVDNSSLTGESDPQERSAKLTHESPMETKNLAFFGTLVLKGRGKGIVINTGDKTLMGRIAKLADSTAQVETPISLEIKDFVKKVSSVAIFLGVTFFVVSMIRNPDPIRSFVFLIGIIVANVPEGLLATVTVSLTLTAQRMASKNVLVKNLEAVETLGSTSVICSDKTGTLTTNIMTVAHVYHDRKHFECNTADASRGEFDSQSDGFRSLTQIAVLCNNARFVDGNIVGDASETALVKFCNCHYGNDIANYRETFRQRFAIPFNSGNKWQLGIHDDAENKEQFLVVLKGAPEKVLNYCDRYYLNGETLELTDQLKKDIADDILVLSNKGERVLGFCRMSLNKNEFGDSYEFEGDNDGNCNFPFGRPGDSKGFVFVGLMSMIDPPRPGVPEAVRQCQSAGIKVIMVTGDHPSTARAIARKVGIIQNLTRDEIAAEKGVKEEDIPESEVNAVVVHGQQLEDIFTLDDDEITTFWNVTLLKQNVVFARTSPQQKLLIVQACQERGGIVAVTGDGVNDSPALKKADIGVAMGITGTDVSKDAADMILLDDNFASIVKGVEEGRIIFDNLKKSIAYTLSSNIPEIAPFLFYAVGGFPLPLSTVLILCVDLGTDMAPAISMAHEGKEANIMERKPRNPQTENLVTWRLISFAYLQIGVLQALAGFYAYMAVLNDYGIPPSAVPGLDSTNQFLDSSQMLCCTGANPTINECTYSANSCGAGSSVNMDYSTRRMALETAQTAYFISIIIVQWADLLICKTRVLSILTHGMRNNFMNRSILFETLLGVAISYIPFVNYIGTRPLKFYHWFPAIPFNFCIFLYDEARKWWIRKNPNGWLHRTTYW